MKPCISQACLFSTSFEEDVKGFMEGGCRTMEIWLTKVEKHLATNSIAQTHALLADHGITCPAASYQGGLLFSSGEQKKLHLDHFRKRLDLCQGLDIPVINLLAEFPPGVDQDGIQRALDSLRETAHWAEAFNTKLSLEFRAKSPFLNNLETTLAFLHAANMGNLGVTLDFFHFHCGPSKLSDIHPGIIDKIFLVQVSDLMGITREMASDSDRIFPGDGDLPLSPFFSTLKQAGYQGFISLELMNPIISKSKVAQVTELGLNSLQRFLSDKPAGKPSP